MAKLQKGQVYATDLTDQQWAILEPLLLQRKGPGRPRTVDLRQVINALLYIARTGCQWELLPKDFPHWSAVRYYYDKCQDGIWERISDASRASVRLKAGREPHPSAAIIGSKSVKTTEAGGERSDDGGKKIKGRKRESLVDMLGNLITVLVHPAGDDDCDGVEFLLNAKADHLPRLVVIFAD